MRHYNTAYRPCQIASGEDTKRLSLASPVRQARGKEQLSYYVDEEHEDDEIIEFQCLSEGCERDDANIRKWGSCLNTVNTIGCGFAPRVQ
jgi:hypothetical protein